MQYTKLAATLLSLAASITGSQAVKICTSVDFSSNGPCQEFSGDVSKCTFLTQPFFKSVGSFDPEGKTCFLMQNVDRCDPQEGITIQEPINNLYWYNYDGTPQNYGNSATAFFCE
ncbi:MAG: hypothetical protein M1820_010150 [Bogoriella megaspora]|nr:MAG: hypothetical protein M1820_010150 [Bogoriella megaspora]